MTEHLSSQTLEGYRRRTLPPADLLRADDHLSACESCRLRAVAGAPAEQALRALDAGLLAEAAAGGQEHPSFEQLAALVEGRLDDADREITESHLELCRLCASEAEDLRAYQITLGAAPRGRGQKATSGSRGFARGLDAFRRLFVAQTPLRAAAAVILIASVSLLGLLVWKQTRTATEVADATHGRAPERETSPHSGAPPEVSRTDGEESSGVTGEGAADALPPETGGSSAATRLAAALDDAGGRVVLNDRGQIEGLPPLSQAARAAVGSALAEGRVSVAPPPADLKGKTETLMGGPGGGESFSLVGPVGKVVREDRPRLSWRPLAGASQYTVTIFDADLKPIAASPPLSGTSWVVTRGLERGRAYTWQVNALKEGEEVTAPAAPAPPARFKILEAAQDEELRRLERAGPRRSRLALGVLYARAGLLEEAEREFVALARANPQSEVARGLLESVRAARRRQR